MKSNQLTILLTCIVLSFVAPSCGPVFYASTGQNVPLLKEKGEISLCLGLGTAIGEDYGFSYFYPSQESADGLSAQFAAAIGKSTAVLSSFYSLKNDGDWNGKGSYFEVGIGKFKNYEKNDLIGEIFIGAGLGSLKNSSGNEFINMNFFKPFVQPSLGYSSRFFDVAVTPRIGLVSYTSRSANLIDTDQQMTLDDFWSKNKKTLVFEPGITIRGGYENFKLQVQYTHTSFNYENDYSVVYDDFISFSLFVLVSPRWKMDN